MGEETFPFFLPQVGDYHWKPILNNITLFQATHLLLLFTWINAIHKYVIFSKFKRARSCQHVQCRFCHISLCSNMQRIKRLEKDICMWMCSVFISSIKLTLHSRNINNEFEAQRICHQLFQFATENERRNDIDVLYLYHFFY